MAKTPLSRDEYLRGVGHIMDKASTLDYIMFLVFESISGCEHDIARAIYFAVEAFSAKRKLLTSVAAANKKSKETKLIKDIIKAAGKANNQRQLYSHRPILIDRKKYGDHLAQMTLKDLQQPSKKKTAAEIQESINIIEDQLAIARKLVVELSQLRSGQRQ